MVCVNQHAHIAKTGWTVINANILDQSEGPTNLNACPPFCFTCLAEVLLKHDVTWLPTTDWSVFCLETVWITIVIHYCNICTIAITVAQLTCGTAGTSSWGWMSAGCTWWYGWHCLYSFWKPLRTLFGVVRGGQTPFSASHWPCVGRCEGPECFCWAGHGGQSTSLGLRYPPAAAGSGAAPSGNAPWTQPHRGAGRAGTPHNIFILHRGYHKTGFLVGSLVDPFTKDQCDFILFVLNSQWIQTNPNKTSKQLQSSEHLSIVFIP